MNTNNIILLRWETIIPDTGVFFDKLSYENELVISIHDYDDNAYEIIIDNPILFHVIDETYLTHYWSSKNKNIGSTFIVNNSNWAEQFVLCKNLNPNIKHYVIATEDECVEFLTEAEPSIFQKNDFSNKL